MSNEGNRALIAAIRKVVIAGLILLVVWVILLILRRAIPTSVINQMSTQYQTKIPDPSLWDWSRSLWGNFPISHQIGERLPITLQLIVLTVLFSLIPTVILLSLGFLITSFKIQPIWLSRVISILRLVLISGGVTIPVFAVSTLFIVFAAIKSGWSPPMESSFGARLLPAYFCSLPLIWLMVQEGHGILMNRKEYISSLELALDVVVRPLIRLLKLVGAIIVMLIAVEQVFVQPGLGRLLLDAAFTRDFPLIFGIVWVFVIIVVLVKLVAELIEIIYNYSTRQTVTVTPAVEKPVSRTGIPKGWLIFSLALVVLIFLVAVVTPLLAPYGGNEVHLMDRLSSPSAKYLLGTDQLGRDILSRLLYAIRTDVLTGAACAVVLSVVAAGWGMLAAYLKSMNNWIGDTLEDLIMLPRDICCAFPWLVLLLLLSSIWMGSLPLAFIVGLVMLPHAVGMMQEAYRSPPQGKGWLQSVLLSIPIAFIFTIAGVTLYVNSLSFLGFGVPPGIPELGSMLSNEGRQYLLAAPWIAKWPVLCLTLIMLVWVMAGDALLEKLGFRSKAVWLKTME